MIYLFDTNAWLRSIERPDELTQKAAAVAFGRSDAQFGLSAISVYEVGQKFRKGKLRLSMPLDLWLATALRPAFVRVIPIDAELAQLSNNLPDFANEDPADRFIVATALKHNLTIITSDRKIRDYADVPTLW